MHMSDLCEKKSKLNLLYGVLCNQYLLYQSILYNNAAKVKGNLVMKKIQVHLASNYNQTTLLGI